MTSWSHSLTKPELKSWEIISKKINTFGQNKYTFGQKLIYIWTKICTLHLISFRLYHVTMILHCYWWKFWSWYTDLSIIFLIISIKNELVIYLDYNRSVLKLFRLLWVIAIFRLVAYLLNMICLKLPITHLIYKSFGLTLIKFCINSLRQEHEIELIQVAFNS